MAMIFRDIPKGFNPLISLERSAITRWVPYRHRWERSIRGVTQRWVLFGALLLPNYVGIGNP